MKNRRSAATTRDSFWTQFAPSACYLCRCTGGLARCSSCRAHLASEPHDTRSSGLDSAGHAVADADSPCVGRDSRSRAESIFTRFEAATFLLTCVRVSSKCVGKIGIIRLFTYRVLRRIAYTVRVSCSAIEDSVLVIVWLIKWRGGHERRRRRSDPLRTCFMWYPKRTCP